jgi:hypothetical protein
MALRLEDEPKYRLSLYLRDTPDEFEWHERELRGFLGTRLGSEASAGEAIAEADEKGSAARTIEYALGHTARVVILRVATWRSFPIIDTNPIVQKAQLKRRT